MSDNTPPENIEFGRLTHLLLENFKAFGRLQRIPIRPITLIYGKNNSGKSSIIQALLYAEHVRRTKEMSSLVIEKDGNKVIEGGLPRLAHGHGAKRPRFGWEWSSSPNATGFERGRYIQDLGEVTLNASLNETELFSFKNEDAFLNPTPNEKHPALKAVVMHIQRWLAHEFRLSIKTGEAKGELKNELEAACETLESGGYEGPIFHEAFGKASGLQISELALPPIFANRSDAEEDWELFIRLPGMRESAVLARGFEGADRRMRERMDQTDLRLSWGLQESMEKHVDDFIEKRAAFILFRWLQDVWAHFTQPLDALVGKVHYLSAVRSRLDRVFLREPEDHTKPYRDRRRIFTAHHRDWIFQEAAINDANQWLRRHRDLTGDIEIKHETIANKGAHIGTATTLSIYDRKRKVELGFNEVGFGISQFLPVLLACFARQDRHLEETVGTVVVEEPEAHVHPALQSEIADLFIQAVSRKGRPLAYVIAETHSEHLLLRVMRRIREGKLSPSNVAVLYVENVGKQSVVREMPLNHKGQLVRDWPGGFFEEGLRELLL